MQGPGLGVDAVVHEAARPLHGVAHVQHQLALQRQRGALRHTDGGAARLDPDVGRNRQVAGDDQLLPLRIQRVLSLYKMRGHAAILVLLDDLPQSPFCPEIAFVVYHHIVRCRRRIGQYRGDQHHQQYHRHQRGKNSAARKLQLSHRLFLLVNLSLAPPADDTAGPLLRMLRACPFVKKGRPGTVPSRPTQAIMPLR